MNIGRAIRVLMAEKDLSLEHITSATGWSKGYVSNCRRGRADAQARLSEWAAVLGVSPSRLIRRAEEYGEMRK